MKEKDQFTLYVCKRMGQGMGEVKRVRGGGEEKGRKERKNMNKMGRGKTGFVLCLSRPLTSWSEMSRGDTV